MRGVPPGQAVDVLLAAYRQGAFPMASGRRGTVRLYQADPRSILPLTPGGLSVSRSLRAAVRRRTFELTCDTAFAEVIRRCADAPRSQDGLAWINQWIIDAYSALHAAGHAHSIEAWAGSGTERRLVGGLYGVHIGGAFFGESMFSLPALGGTNASKICLVALWNHLRARGLSLLDTQIANEHMRQFGIVEVPHAEYKSLLAAALPQPCTWGLAPGPMVTPGGVPDPLSSPRDDAGALDP